MEALSLIDVSAEDDLLFDLATPPPAPAPPRHPDPTHGGSLVGAEAAPHVVPADGSPAAASRTADPDGVTEEQSAPERTESPKQRKVKKGVNLRKSLAWDSAFFTSEGVLDTEELAMANSTFRRTQGSRLPGIVEEMRKSGDSTSTLDSEVWATESLDTQLFDSVRASIQKSLAKPNKVPGGPAGSSKPPKATANGPCIAARKGVDRIPQTKIRDPVSTSQGAVGGKQRPQVSSKMSAAARVKNLPGAAEAKTSSKPPRALPRVAVMRSSTNTAITPATLDKRSSTGGVVNRPAAAKAANTSASRRLGRVTVEKSVALTSTNSSSCGLDTRDKAKTKSTLSNPIRTAQRVPVRSSSKPDTSRPLPPRSGSKIPTRGHVGRASPTISPHSSVDSMSSVISGASTASTIGKMSHTSESLNTLSPSLRKSNDCPLTPKLRPTTVKEGLSACADSSNASTDVTNQGKGFKPTGLRRPTPKIGYFDAEKSIEHNMGAQVQQQPMKIQCLLPATPTASSIAKQESKLNAAALEEHDPPLEVMAQPEADKSIDQSVDAPVPLMEIQCLHPATPTSQASSNICRQERKRIASPFEEINASKSKATKAVPVEAVKVGVDPLKVAKLEACLHQADLVVATDTPKENIPTDHQNVQANVDASSLVDLLTQKLSSISLGEATPNLAS
nr:unnamed protein product [Digitaria exilis]